jgi:hypothetical protein
MQPALDLAGYRVLKSGLLVSPLLGGPARHRPFAPTPHLHQRKSSRNLHLQYSVKSQSTPRCQSLITARSDHPPILRRSGPHRPTRLPLLAPRVAAAARPARPCSPFKCIQGERASSFSSPLSSNAKMPPHLPSLLEIKIACTVAIGRAFLLLPMAFGVSLRAVGVGGSSSQCCYAELHVALVLTESNNSFLKTFF